MVSRAGGFYSPLTPTVGDRNGERAMNQVEEKRVEKVRAELKAANRKLDLALAVLKKKR